METVSLTSIGIGALILRRSTGLAHSFCTGGLIFVCMIHSLEIHICCVEKHCYPQQVQGLAPCKPSKMPCIHMLSRFMCYTCVTRTTSSQPFHLHWYRLHKMQQDSQTQTCKTTKPSQSSLADEIESCVSLQLEYTFWRNIGVSPGQIRKHSRAQNDMTGPQEWE